jgi:hypothetical protein
MDELNDKKGRRMITFDSPFLIICIVSIPVIVCSAVRNDLNPSIGFVRFLMNRWSLFYDVTQKRACILPTMDIIEACLSMIFIGYGWAKKFVKTRLGIFGSRWL